jgi:hypothetical protein
MVRNYIRQIIRRFGFDVVKLSNTIGPPKSQGLDPKFIEFWYKTEHISGFPWQAYLTIWEATKYIIDNHIQGDFVECGVQNGKGIMFIAQALSEYCHDKKRKIYLYDTFTGMSAPTKNDYMGEGDVRSYASDILSSWPTRDGIKDFCYGPFEEVVERIRALDYPFSNFVFVKGMVEETIPKTMPKVISLLKCDTDWYESTKHELEYLYPNLIENGVLIIDDYGCWNGARKATDEYFSNIAHRPLMILDAPHGSRVCQKVKLLSGDIIGARGIKM